MVDEMIERNRSLMNEWAESGGYHPIDGSNGVGVGVD